MFSGASEHTVKLESGCKLVVEYSFIKCIDCSYLRHYSHVVLVHLSLPHPAAT